MVAVDIVDGVKYGFKLLGAILAISIAGGVLLLIGADLAPNRFGGGSPILALLFFVAGIALIYAGGLGLLYKVIADAVEAGNRAAEYPPAGTGAAPAQHQPTQGANQQR